MDCIFEKIAESQWECQRCRARYTYLPVRQCDADPKKPKPPKHESWVSTAANVPASRGPGDYLHDAIVRLTGESPTEDCQCRSRIAQMNTWDPTGCREHIDEIIDWLFDEAQQRGWRITKLPGARWTVKQLVLQAIRKAERDAAG